MNTEFYKQMLSIKRDNGWSCGDMARACNLCRGTLIEFFNVGKPFRPLRDATMGKIHHAFGISYKTMEEYNEVINKNRGE